MREPQIYVHTQCAEEIFMNSRRPLMIMLKTSVSCANVTKRNIWFTESSYSLSYSPKHSACNGRHGGEQHGSSYLLYH